MSRPSTLPMKLIPGAACSSSNASLRSVSPLPGSSPIDSRPTLRLGHAEAVAGVDRAHLGELHQPLGLAPRRWRRRRAGRSAWSRARGSAWRWPGGLTPLMRPMRSSADAIVAPVLPAETIADALPSRTASAARTSVESFLRRTRRRRVLVHRDDLAGLDQRRGRRVVGRGRRRADEDDGDAVVDGAGGTPATISPGPGRRPWRRPRSAASSAAAAVSSTSTATRSLYHPQVGHTVCGCLALPQRGQMLRAGASSFQAAGAVAARLFDFDFFFLGTAIARWSPRQASRAVARLAPADAATLRRLSRAVGRARPSGRRPSVRVARSRPVVAVGAARGHSPGSRRGTAARVGDGEQRPPRGPSGARSSWPCSIGNARRPRRGPSA